LAAPGGSVEQQDVSRERQGLQPLRDFTSTLGAQAIHKTKCLN
jgi:hypothetical protein